MGLYEFRALLIQVLGNVVLSAWTLELNLDSTNEELVILGTLNSLVKPWFPHLETSLITGAARRLNDRVNAWAVLNLVLGN